MGLGRHPIGQGQLDRGQHRLLVMLQDQGEDIDHLPISAGSSQHLVLQSPEA